MRVYVCVLGGCMCVCFPFRVRVQAFDYTVNICTQLSFCIVAYP